MSLDSWLDQTCMVQTSSTYKVVVLELSSEVFTHNIDARGVHPPWDHDAFPPCFRFSPIFEKCSDSVKNFQHFTFSRKISRFSSAKISHDFFFSHQPQIPISVHFPPCFAKIIIPPALENFPLVLENFTCFSRTFVYFVSPLLWPWCIYASPNARTGRPWLMLNY